MILFKSLLSTSRSLYQLQVRNTQPDIRSRAMKHNYDREADLAVRILVAEIPSPLALVPSGARSALRAQRGKVPYAVLSTLPK